MGGCIPKAQYAVVYRSAEGFYMCVIINCTRPKSRMKNKELKIGLMWESFGTKLMRTRMDRKSF